MNLYMTAGKPCRWKSFVHLVRNSRPRYRRAEALHIERLCKIQTHEIGDKVRNVSLGVANCIYCLIASHIPQEADR